MNSAFRHLSVRLWLTAFLGAIICIVMLPWWQQLFGVKWLILPSSLILCVCFALTGWMMNRIGAFFLKRHADEAAVWERAGMMSEAQRGLRKAMSTFDSFWLSPLLRQKKRQWFSGMVAKFYLGRHQQSAFARSFLSIYLKSFPFDETVAQPWLEQLLTYEVHLPQEHEIAARVNECHPQNQRIQRLLMQFFMVNGRTDFEAMQTYRRVWKTQQPMPGETVHSLARILLNDYILNPWALQVYLNAYEIGHTESLEGIVAAVRLLPITEESQSLLSVAQNIIEGVESEKGISLNPKFKPVQVQPPDKKVSRTSSSNPPTGQSLIGMMTELHDKSQQFVKRAWALIAAMPLKRILPVVGAVIIIVLSALAGWHIFSTPDKKEKQATQKVVEKIVVSDPFTIQVAAYVKEKDAQKFVDQLTQKGLDAFWTKATSSNRAWYQVKVSHFATRQEAQKYGQTLKSKGLINDFYVANYDMGKARGK